MIISFPRQITYRSPSSTTLHKLLYSYYKDLLSVVVSKTFTGARVPLLHQRERRISGVINKKIKKTEHNNKKKRNDFCRGHQRGTDFVRVYRYVNKSPSNDVGKAIVSNFVGIIINDCYRVDDGSFFIIIITIIFPFQRFISYPRSCRHRSRVTHNEIYGARFSFSFSRVRGHRRESHIVIIITRLVCGTRDPYNA